VGLGLVDVDQFVDNSSAGFDSYFGLKEELEALLGRPWTW
jgi:hypothetical protein